MTKKRKITILFATSLSIIALLTIVYYFQQSRGKRPGRPPKIWSIGIYTGKSPLNLSSPDFIPNPVLTAEDVSDVPADFVADPFMVKEEGTWYMFFEVFNNRSQHGDIGLAVSQDGYNWTYRRIVLDMPFHLSYPFVFKWEDDYYLIPESFEADSVQLYKAEDFPARWILVGRLLEGNFVDSTILFHDQTFWLFAETNPKGNDRLSLFSSPLLTGPWAGHPQNPIIRKDANIARPAGRIVESSGHLLRFVQDDSPTYGNRIRAFEIRELTQNAYQEIEVDMSPIL
ncbi:hypothetical protein KA005_41420, partial [bacterium]|nr:hypothetical protein [bacterium]